MEDDDDDDDNDDDEDSDDFSDNENSEEMVDEENKDFGLKSLLEVDENKQSQVCWNSFKLKIVSKKYVHTCMTITFFD